MRPTDISADEIRVLELLAAGRTELARLPLRLEAEYQRFARSSSRAGKLAMMLTPALIFLLLGCTAPFTNWVQDAYLPESTPAALFALSAASFLVTWTIWKNVQAAYTEWLIVALALALTIAFEWLRLGSPAASKSLDQALIFCVPIAVLALGRPERRISQLFVIGYLLIRTGEIFWDRDSFASGRWIGEWIAQLLCLGAAFAGHIWATRTQRRDYASRLLLAINASRDPLTDLANRRSLSQHFELATQAVGRGERKTLVLAVVDVDFFKRVNDHYGHAYGDQVLVRLAHVLRSKARRPFDMAARIGGEEFALLLYDCDSTHALRILVETCEQVRLEKLANVGSPFGCVTVSIGAAIAGPGVSLQDCYRVADEQLYSAKLRGRNRVYLADPMSLSVDGNSKSRPHIALKRPQRPPAA